MGPADLPRLPSSARSAGDEYHADNTGEDRADESRLRNREAFAIDERVCTVGIASVHRSVPVVVATVITDDRGAALQGIGHPGAARVALVRKSIESVVDAIAALGPPIDPLPHRDVGLRRPEEWTEVAVAHPDPLQILDEIGQQSDVREAVLVEIPGSIARREPVEASARPVGSKGIGDPRRGILDL